VVFSYVYWDDVHRSCISWRRFAMLRFARMYPLHFATLIIAGGLAWVFHTLTGRFPIYVNNGAEAFTANLLMLQAGVLGYSFNGPAWSLSIEAILYCIFFLVARRNLQAFAIGAMLLLGVGIIQCPLKDWSVDTLLFARGLFGFGLGMAVYRAAKQPRRVCLLLIGFAAFIFVARRSWMYGGDPRLRYLAAAAFGASFFLIIIRVPAFQRMLEIRPLLMLGDLSLPIYLVHIPVQMLVLLIVHELGMDIPFSAWWFWLAYSGAVVAVAATVHHFYELPARRYLRSIFVDAHGAVMQGAPRPSSALGNSR
jgi:peptidoglycan/LPS O-acetylase OafA/YrhL